MNELDLLNRLLPGLPSSDCVMVGAGDDCAVLDVGAPEHLLFKTDAVVEGVHFTSQTPPEKVGRKALARCLSDIAAMAGRTFLFWVITKGQQMAEHNGYEQSTGRNCGGIAVMEVAMAER